MGSRRRVAASDWMHTPVIAVRRAEGQHTPVPGLRSPGDRNIPRCKDTIRRRTVAADLRLIVATVTDRDADIPNQQHWPSPLKYMRADSGAAERFHVAAGNRLEEMTPFGFGQDSPHGVEHAPPTQTLPFPPSHSMTWLWPTGRGYADRRRSIPDTARIRLVLPCRFLTAAKARSASTGRIIAARADLSVQ